jgi:hypothetical protein
MVVWTDSARRQYERLGGRYATDLTDAEFALMEPFLPPPRPGRAVADDELARSAERNPVRVAERLSLRGLLAASPSAIGSIAY